MNDNLTEIEFEEQRLKQTINLAENQLNQAILENEATKDAITDAKREMGENSAHSISGLWSSDGFEDLVALSQYVNPIMNKFAAYEATENRIAMLERMIVSPYFARIDFKFDDEDAFEKIYIGRSSLIDDGSGTIFVYDWRSPIAGMFYRFSTGPAHYDAPAGRLSGEISLKRQYEIKRGKLEYFFDADVQIIDEFLRKLLSQNTSSKMKAIVETIQKEQDIVIRDMENELMMVQGVTGSGKTSIALHRAAYLMYRGVTSGLSADNIIIISPSAVFGRYISGVLPELGEDNVVSEVLEDILAVVLNSGNIQSRGRFWEILLTSPRFQNTMKQSIEFKSSRRFLDVLARFIGDIPERWIDFSDIYYAGHRVWSKAELKGKVVSGRKSTPLGQRLKLLEDSILEPVKELHREYADISEYQRVKREVRELTELDAAGLYGKLLADEDYFFSLADGIELPECISDILRFTRENLNGKTLYYDDAAVIAFLKLKLCGADDYKNIKQAIIDEAQDYYPIHYEIFGMLFQGAKFTILGDVNQTLEKREDMSLYENIGEILGKKKQALVTMDKSFRCTNEILNFSSRFIPRSAEIKSFNRAGAEPGVHAAADESSLCGMIASEVRSCLDFGCQSVGLICRTEKNSRSLFERLRGLIDVKIIDSEGAGDLSGVFVIPVYLSKGLEFDAVLVCDADKANYHSEDDKNLLYIACTRALHRLNLFCAGEVSALI